MRYLLIIVASSAVGVLIAGAETFLLTPANEVSPPVAVNSPPPANGVIDVGANEIVGATPPAAVERNQPVLDPTPVGAVEPSRPVAPARPGGQALNYPPAPAPASIGQERPSPEACLSPEEIDDRDGDIGRNKAKLASADLCIQMDQFDEGGQRWALMIIRHRPDPKRGPGRFLWMVPHNNEHDAFDSAVSSVSLYGGTVVAVKTGGTRFNGPQDPNRNFDVGPEFGAHGKCREQVARSPLYTEHVMRWRGEGAPIIALHTNEPGFAGDGRGGAGGISILHPLSGATPFRAKAAAIGRSPDDTMVFVASPRKPEADAELMAFVERLREHGINVMYETVSLARNDCSMSNFAAIRGIRNYANVEVVQGDGATQRKIVEALVGLLDEGRIGAMVQEKPKPAPGKPPGRSNAPGGPGVAPSGIR
jgi:hypothetical protein